MPFSIATTPFYVSSGSARGSKFLLHDILKAEEATGDWRHLPQTQEAGPCTPAGCEETD